MCRLVLRWITILRLTTTDQKIRSSLKIWKLVRDSVTANASRGHCCSCRALYRKTEVEKICVKNWMTITKPFDRSLQLQFVCDFWRNLLKSDRSSGDSLEPNAVEWKPRKFAHLDLPLDEWVRVGIAVNAKQKESFALFVVTIVRVENLVQLGRNAF